MNNKLLILVFSLFLTFAFFGSTNNIFKKSIAIQASDEHFPEFLSLIDEGLNAISLPEKLGLDNNWFNKDKEIQKEFLLDLTQKEKNYLLKNETLKVQGLATFPPFNYTENKKAKGYTYEYMKLMSKYSGIEFKFTEAKSFGETISMFKNHKIDIIPHIARNKIRAEYMDFTDFNHLKYSIGVTVRKNNLINTMEDLEDKIIAVVNKSFIYTFLKKNYPNQKILLSPSTSEAVTLVSSGKADALIGSIPTMNFYIQQNWHNNIVTRIIDDIGLNNKVSMTMGVIKGNTILKSILEKANSAIPNNEIVNLKEKWLNINSDDLINLSFTEEERLFLNQKKIIKMCVLPNWLPFEQIDENIKHKGIGADIIKIISEKINIPIVLVPTKQWSESLQNIKDRKCDILPVAMDVPSRRVFMDFTKPYVSEPFVIATKMDELFIKDVKSIGKRKVGIVKNYAFSEVLKKNNPEIKIIDVKNAKEGLERVESGELFGYVDIMAAIGYNIQKYSFVNLKIAGKLEHDITLSIASRKDEPLLSSIMQKTLETISEDKFRTIVGEWIKIKVEQSFDYSKLFYIVGFFSILISLILYKNRSISAINTKLKEEKKITESLTHFQQGLLSLFDRGDAVLFKWKTTDRKKVDFISQSIYGLTGFSQEDFTSGKMAYSQCIHKEDFNRVVQKNKEGLLEKSSYFRHEPYRIITKDGIQKWVLDYRVSEKNEDGVIYLLGYISDITEHVHHQANTSHQAKMASLGEMIGNIAHQWRQPLSLISSVATGSILQKQINTLSNEEFEKNMYLINENVQYLSKTIDDFRNFIKGSHDIIQFNLSDKIDTFLNLVNSSIVSNHIQIIKECDSTIQLKNHPNDLIQSLMNLYNNAKDVLKELPEDERYFFISTKRVANEILITVKDNGKGISENMLGKIFEPYTTTKHQSQGTGLGMNITYNFIVTSMKGTISAENTKFNYKGKQYVGAKFEISLFI